jgi:hypothetical protein
MAKQVIKARETSDHDAAKQVITITRDARRHQPQVSVASPCKRTSAGAKVMARGRFQMRAGLSVQAPKANEPNVAGPSRRQLSAPASILPAIIALYGCTVGCSNTSSSKMQRSEPSTVREPQQTASPDVVPSSAPENPALTKQQAIVELLEQQQLETQAEHMRAKAEYESNSDCEAYRRCRDSIPSISELRPGEFARLSRSCDRSKSESCRVVERQLEIARADNLAKLSRLQAERNRLRTLGAVSPMHAAVATAADLELRDPKDIEREAATTLNKMFRAISDYYGRVGKLPAPIARTPTEVPCKPREWTAAEREVWSKAIGFPVTGDLGNSYELRDAAELNLHDGTLLILRANADRDCDGELATIDLSMGITDGELIHGKGFYFEHE